MIHFFYAIALWRSANSKRWISTEMLTLERVRLPHGWPVTCSNDGKICRPYFIISLPKNVTCLCSLLSALLSQGRSEGVFFYWHHFGNQPRCHHCVILHLQIALYVLLLLGFEVFSFCKLLFNLNVLLRGDDFSCTLENSNGSNWILKGKNNYNKYYLYV